MSNLQAMERPQLAIHKNMYKVTENYGQFSIIRKGGFDGYGARISDSVISEHNLLRKAKAHCFELNRNLNNILIDITNAYESSFRKSGIGDAIIVLAENLDSGEVFWQFETVERCIGDSMYMLGGHEEHRVIYVVTNEMLIQGIT